MTTVGVKGLTIAAVCLLVCLFVTDVVMRINCGRQRSVAQCHHSASGGQPLVLTHQGDTLISTPFGSKRHVSEFLNHRTRINTFSVSIHV